MGKNRFIFDEKTASFVPYESNSRKKYFIFIPVLALLILGGVALGFYLPEDKTSAQAHSEKELLVVKNQYKKLQSELEEIENSLENVQSKDDHIYRTFFQMDTLTDADRQVGIGGSERYEQFSGYKLGDLIISSSEKVDILRQRLKMQEKSLDEIRSKAASKSNQLLHIPAIQPISNKELTRLASGFGMRRHPILGISRMHEGLDFTAPRGTPIYASANGVVKTAGVHNGYGNTVIIDHQNGYETLYAHMSKINARSGATVKRGQVIGYVGSTGLSSGPHLHYEIKKDGVKINPITYFYNDLNSEQYKKLKEVSELSETSWD